MAYPRVEITLKGPAQDVADLFTEMGATGNECYTVRVPSRGRRIFSRGTAHHVVADLRLAGVGDDEIVSASADASLFQPVRPGFSLTPQDRDAIERGVAEMERNMVSMMGFDGSKLDGLGL